MDWSDLLPILIGLLAVVGLPFAFRRRKKEGPKKTEELCQHLQGMGIKASVLESGANQEKVGGKRSWGRKSVGVIKLAGKDIDSLNVTGVASQYGVQYFLDFIVRSSSLTGKENKQKTKMVRKKSSLLLGKTIDIEWKGDDFLARKLNIDYRLQDRLLQADISVLKGGVSIFPEPGQGYTRIRTTYFMPTPDLFEAMGIIAKHIKSA